MPSLTLMNSRRAPAAARGAATQSAGLLSESGASVSELSLPQDDQLGSIFGELQDFSALTSLLEDAAAALLQVPEKLDPLVEHLGGAGAGESPEARLVLRLTRELGALSSRLKGAAPHLEGMQQLVRQSRFQGIRAREAFASREAARVTKLQCEEQAAALYVRATEQPFALEEKKARLAARETAHEAFRSASDRAERAAGTVLCRKPATTAAMLSRFCHYVAAASENTRALERELRAAEGGSSWAPAMPQALACAAGTWLPQLPWCGTSQGRASGAFVREELEFATPLPLELAGTAPETCAADDESDDAALWRLGAEADRLMREAQRRASEMLSRAQASEAEGEAGSGVPAGAAGGA